MTRKTFLICSVCLLSVFAPASAMGQLAASCQVPESLRDTLESVGSQWLLQRDMWVQRKSATELNGIKGTRQYYFHGGVGLGWGQIPAPGDGPQALLQKARTRTVFEAQMAEPRLTKLNRHQRAGALEMALASMDMGDLDAWPLQKEEKFFTRVQNMVFVRCEQAAKRAR